MKFVKISCQFVMVSAWGESVFGRSHLSFIYLVQWNDWESNNGKTSEKQSVLMATRCSLIWWIPKFEYRFVWSFFWNDFTWSFNNAKRYIFSFVMLFPQLKVKIFVFFAHLFNNAEVKNICRKQNNDMCLSSKTPSTLSV